jgi:hypothetical protein
MDYYDLYLRFPDQKTAEENLKLVENNSDINVDVIGVITKTNSETLETTTVDGYHVNVRYAYNALFPDEWETFLIEQPKNPVRVWA